MNIKNILFSILFLATFSSSLTVGEIPCGRNKLAAEGALLILLTIIQVPLVVMVVPDFIIRKLSNSREILEHCVKTFQHFKKLEDEKLKTDQK